MKALLEAKYPTLNADVLLDIASHTPNAQIAIEKLCGLYVPHTIDSLGRFRKNKNTVYILMDINHWDESVTYCYQYEEEYACYVPKHIAETVELTIDNIKDHKCNYNDSNAVWKSVKTGKLLDRKDVMSITDWLSKEQLEEYNGTIPSNPMVELY